MIRCQTIIRVDWIKRESNRRMEEFAINEMKISWELQTYKISWNQSNLHKTRKVNIRVKANFA